MTFIFKYETPFRLKKIGKNRELRELMGKIYKKDYVLQRIEVIEVREIVGLEFVFRVHVPTI